MKTILWVLFIFLSIDSFGQFFEDRYPLGKYPYMNYMPGLIVDTPGGVAFESPWIPRSVKFNVQGVSHWHGQTQPTGVGGGDFTFFKTRPGGAALQLGDEVWYLEWRANNGVTDWQIRDSSKLFDELVTIGNTSVANKPGGLYQLRSVYGGNFVIGLTQDHLGNVGVGITNPSFKLDVNGGARVLGTITSLNSIVGLGSGNPTVTLNGGTVNGVGGGFIFQRGGSDIGYFAGASWVTSGADNSNNLAIYGYQGTKIFVNNSIADQNTFQFTDKGFITSKFTGAQASAISSPTDGSVIYVTSTNGVFTSVGFWGYENGTWQKFTMPENQLTANGNTTNATPATVISIPLAAGQAIRIDADMVGKSGNDYLRGRKTAAIKNVGGTLSVVGSVADIVTTMSEGTISTASFTITISGTNVIVQATGVAATTIDWNAIVKYKIDAL